MCFVLFTGIEEYDIESAGITLNKKGAKKYNVFVCPETQTLHFDSELGAEDVKYNSHDELLNVVTFLGKRIYAGDMLEKLSNAEFEILRNERFPVLTTYGNEINQLIAHIRRIRDGYANYNFVLVIKLGQLDDSYVHAILNDRPSITYVINKAKEHAKELCYKSDDRDVKYWCDSYDPLVHADVYAVPEEKRIIIIFNVEDVGEVYRHTMGYNTAEEFLKALEDYSGIAGFKE
jgi:hypothetical protein